MLSVYKWQNLRPKEGSGFCTSDNSFLAELRLGPKSPGSKTKAFLLTPAPYLSSLFSAECMPRPMPHLRIYHLVVDDTECDTYRLTIFL